MWRNSQLLTVNFCRTVRVCLLPDIWVPCAVSWPQAESWERENLLCMNCDNILAVQMEICHVEDDLRCALLQLKYFQTGPVFWLLISKLLWISVLWPITPCHHYHLSWSDILCVRDCLYVSHRNVVNSAEWSAYRTFNSTFRLWRFWWPESMWLNKDFLFSSNKTLSSICWCTNAGVVLYVPVFPSVLWYCRWGLLICKNCRPYNLYCVGADLKPCSTNFMSQFKWCWWLPVCSFVSRQCSRNIDT